MAAEYFKRWLRCVIGLDGAVHTLAYEETESVPMATSSRDDHLRKGRPGRIGSLFRLNRKRYEEMKVEGGKVEF